MDVVAVGFVLLSAVFSATIGVFAKITGLSPEVITFFRLIIGAFLMLCYLTLIGKTRLLGKWPTWPVLLNGAFLAGFMVFYIQAMEFTSMANAVMLIYLAPVVASVIAHFFMGERLTLISSGLIFLALLGFWMMMEFRIDFSRDSREFIGIGIGLLATISYAGFILINRLIDRSVHVYSRTFYQLLTGACVMAPLIIGSIQEVTIAHIPWLFGVGLLPGFLGILFAVAALSRLPASVFGTIAYAEPVAVVVFGWTLFNETLGSLQICGCLLIIASGIIRAFAGTVKER